MAGFLLKRAVTALLVILGATFGAYVLMMFAPGDPALEIALSRYGWDIGADRETVEWIRKTEGLDKPAVVQYFRWLKHTLKLDLGKSLVEEEGVSHLILSRLPNTVILAATAIFTAMVISIPLGILSGIRRGSWLDSTAVAVGVSGVSMPNYWLGLILIIVFSVKLRWLPAFGVGGWKNIILPALTLGTGLTAYTTRILRSAVIETLDAEFIMALKSRGIGGRLGRHILKNAMIPVVTVVGLEFGMILEGAVITETVFAWPGLGELMVNAVSNRDYPLIQGMVLFCAVIFITINLVTDILYRLLDPRIRL